MTNVKDLVLVVLTGAYVVLTAFLAHYARRSTQASENSARAAEESAMASCRAAEIAHESMVHGNRAYVTLESASWQVRPGGTGIPRIQFNLKNAGQTPALEGKVGYRLVVWNMELQDSHFEQLKFQDFVMAPQTITTFEEILGTMPDLHEMNALNSKQTHLWIYGQVTYKDIFGNPHQTRWCLAYASELVSGLRMWTAHNTMN